MNTIELTVTPRQHIGSSSSRALRRQGRLPAVLYGPSRASCLLSLDTRVLEKVLQKHSSGQVIFNLDIVNGTSTKCLAMIKELQMHPVSRRFLHADFYEIAMDRKISAMVPIHTVGTCRGVEEEGGMLQIIRRELEVWCLPMAIPAAIEVDVTDLNVGDSVHVADLPLPEAVEIPFDVNFTILTVLGAQTEAAAAAETETEEAEEKPEESEE